MAELKRILLVDDDPNDVELTLTSLNRHNLANEVMVAGDGEEALDVLYRRGKYIDLPAGHPSVILLDDDKGVCHLLTQLLEVDHQVKIFGDGGEALTQFVPGQYDVALVDLGMSGLAGDALVKEMRQADPRIATVLITGWELPTTDSRRMAFDFQLQKPFDDLDEVEEIVAQAMRLHDVRAEGTR